MNESESEIYLAPSDLLSIPPCGSKGTSPVVRPPLNDNHVIIPTSSTSNDQISSSIPDKSFPNYNSTANFLLEAVYHKGTWFAVNRKQLEDYQGLERCGKLSEVRIVKLELMDLPEELRLCLLESRHHQQQQQTDPNECSELSDGKR